MATHLTGPRCLLQRSRVFNRAMLSQAEISDRLEIQQLLVDYSTAIDLRRFDDLDAVFTPDAYIDYTALGGIEGRYPEVKAWLAQVLPNFPMYSHMLGGPEAAVAKMDAKAASLGAVNTHASTPSGLDGPRGSGWSTAHDLAVIFRAAMANPVFAQITAEPSAVFPGDNGDHPISNQDELLQRYPGAIGGKTGFTDAARKTFVGAATRGGRRLVVAMMYGLVHPGGPTYWDQAGGLLDWGFALNPQSAIGTL